MKTKNERKIENQEPAKKTTEKQNQIPKKIRRGTTGKKIQKTSRYCAASHIGMPVGARHFSAPTGDNRVYPRAP
jgi:hypothetical protein